MEFVSQSVISCISLTVSSRTDLSCIVLAGYLFVVGALSLVPKASFTISFTSFTSHFVPSFFLLHWFFHLPSGNKWHISPQLFFPLICFFPPWACISCRTTCIQVSAWLHTLQPYISCRTTFSQVSAWLHTLQPYISCRTTFSQVSAWLHTLQPYISNMLCSNAVRNTHTLVSYLFHFWNVSHILLTSMRCHCPLLPFRPVLPLGFTIVYSVPVLIVPVP